MEALSAVERSIVERAAAVPMRSQVEAWASINTGTSNLEGLATMADLLAGACAALPGEIRLIEAEPVETISADGSIRITPHGRHLHLAVRPGANRRVLLTGHMDTVFAADHPFQTPREIEPGIINGPGVADMKGGLAIMLAALTAFETSPDANGLGYDVMINSDEETGSASSASLITSLASGKLAALIYEPSALPDGTLAGARPGSGNFSIVVTGKSAHAGRNPGDGRNALVAAAALAVRLSEAASPSLSINPARIDGGGPNNVVPDHAVLRVNMRPATPADETRARALLAALTTEIAATHEVAIHTHGGFGRPPKPLDPPAERLFGLVRDCSRDLGRDLSWMPTGGVCDGNNIAACGVPVIDTMGARGGAIHSSDEYLIVDSLVERAQLSALTLQRIVTGRFA